jgi:acyl dehydratase
MPTRIIEDLESLRSLVGQEIGVSDWFDIPQSLIDGFAHCAADHQWIHVDVERARRESSFGAPIAHGFLTLSLLSHLHRQAVEVRGCRLTLNYGLNRVRFPATVPAGSRVRCHSKLMAIADKKNAIQATWHMTVERHGQTKPVLAAEWILWYLS